VWFKKCVSDPDYTTRRQRGEQVVPGKFKKPTIPPKAQGLWPCNPYCPGTQAARPVDKREAPKMGS